MSALIINFNAEGNPWQNTSLKWLNSVFNYEKAIHIYLLCTSEELEDDVILTFK